MEGDKVAPLVARVSDAVAARLEEVAAEAGVSYHTLYAWGRGRRNASAEHLIRLAAVVRRRADVLQDLARELEAQADTSTKSDRRSVARSAREDGLAEAASGSDKAGRSGNGITEPEHRGVGSYR